MSGARLVPLAVAVLLVSCATSPPLLAGDSSAAKPEVPRPLLAPATDLSGAWAAGTGDPPAVDTIVLHPHYAYVPPAWLLEQSGNAIKAWHFPEQFNQGIMRRDAGAARVAAYEGVISGDSVWFHDGNYGYRLRFDPTRGHLVGARDATSFWLVRQRVIRTEVCPGIP